MGCGLLDDLQSDSYSLMALCYYEAKFVDLRISNLYCCPFLSLKINVLTMSFFADSDNLPSSCQ